LMSYDWIMLAQDQVAISRLGSYFSSNGISPPKIIMETNSFETAFSMVKEGNFLTSAASSMSKMAKIAGLIPLHIQGTLWKFPAGVSFRRSTATPRMVSIFIKILKKEVNKVLAN